MTVTEVGRRASPDPNHTRTIDDSQGLRDPRLPPHHIVYS